MIRLGEIEKKKDFLVSKIKRRKSVWNTEQCCYSHWKKICIDFICKKCNQRLHSSLMSIKTLKETLRGGCDCGKREDSL